MTQNQETDSGQDEQGALVPDLTGYTREGVIAWIRANTSQPEPAKSHQHARTAVIEQTARKQVERARQELDSLDPEHGYRLEAIKGWLTKAGIENLPIDDKGYGQFLRQCYPPAESVNRRWVTGGNTHRRWTGIGDG